MRAAAELPEGEDGPEAQVELVEAAPEEARQHRDPAAHERGRYLPQPRAVSRLAGAVLLSSTSSEQEVAAGVLDGSNSACTMGGRRAVEPGVVALLPARLRRTPEAFASRRALASGEDGVLPWARARRRAVSVR